MVVMSATRQYSRIYTLGGKKAGIAISLAEGAETSCCGSGNKDITDYCGEIPTQFPVQIPVHIPLWGGRVLVYVYPSQHVTGNIFHKHYVKYSVPQ